MSESTTKVSGHRLRGAAFLIALAMLAAGLLAGVDRFTAPRIADNIAEQRLKGLRAILPANSYDNEPHLDIRTARHAELLGSEAPLPVYRARLGQEPVAAVLTVIAPNGFSGRIHLLVAIDVDGVVTGVRVIEHRETPGLGDRIEAGKSDWIRGFSDLTSSGPRGEWVLKRDGGSFDQITGATVTSRAVLNAVRNAVIYFADHRREIFAPQPDGPPVTPTRN